MDVIVSASLRIRIVVHVFVLRQFTKQQLVHFICSTFYTEILIFSVSCLFVSLEMCFISYFFVMNVRIPFNFEVIVLLLEYFDFMIL